MTNLSKKKQLKIQKRQAKRFIKSRVRRVNFIKLKNVKKNSSNKIKVKEQKFSSGFTIKSFIGNLILKIKKFGCKIGIHDWKICSGVEGQPMYACMKCWKGSEKKWGKGGSAGHYSEKHEDKIGISDINNWEKDGDSYYFKGIYIDMTKKAEKRLNKILKGQKIRDLRKEDNEK